MPTIKINGCRYYYEEHGKGEETILFSHGLLWSGHMFLKQVAHFQDRYKIITYDHRGQGRSEVTEDGYSIDQLYEDTVQLIQALDLGKVHMAGLSMGGFVAMRVAARNPELVSSLVLMETSAEEEPNTFKYSFLTKIVDWFGVKVVTGPVMDIMFGKKFLKDPYRREEKQYWIQQLQNNNKSITKAVKGVVGRISVEEEITQIKCPTLIFVGTQDKATKPDKAEYMHARIPNSTLIYVEGAGHTACIEEPEQINQGMEAFLNLPRLNG